MVTANAYKRYKEQEVNMANPVALIVMLYGGCIKWLKLAKLDIEKKNYPDANTHMQKAQDIILELISSLDLSFEISKSLLSLYDFMLREIRSINASKDAERIDPVLQLLSSLRETWSQVEKTCRPAYESCESEE